MSDIVEEYLEMIKDPYMARLIKTIKKLNTEIEKRNQKPEAVKSNQLTWLAGIPERGQRQDALRDQLFDLRKAANRLGLYDAADYLAVCMTRDNNYLAR